MQFLQTQKDLSNIKAAPVRIEVVMELKLSGQITTHMVVHDQEELVGVLEGVVELDQEGMMGPGDLRQDVAFHHGMFYFTLSDHPFLADRLQSIKSSRFMMADQDYL
jgi:hypothetical protein